MVGVFIILNIIRHAWLKYKKVKNSELRDPEWKPLYSKVPNRILFMCVLTLTGELVIYTLMAVQFFSLGEYQRLHLTLKLTEYNSKIQLGFDFIEKTILSLVSLTNTLWLPILQIRNWEIKHMIKILIKHDRFKLLQNDAPEHIVKEK